MRTFSRWMPVEEEQPMTWALQILFGVLLVLVAPVMAALWIITAPWMMRDARRFARMQAERAGEGICTFARGFDRRTTDPWIIRAVHDALQPYFVTRSGPVPIRPSDRLYGELRIDGEELDDLARTIAWRTGRPLENADDNPVRPVETVDDLVRFFAHQPRVRAA